jgi:hypothetical protein
MYKLSLLIDVSDGLPGMMVPVFSSPNTNLPYVQQMDEFLIVKSILPFLDYENYSTCLAEVERSIFIGDKGLIAFRSIDNSIICGDVTEVLDYFDQKREIIASSPVLTAQLLRIQAAELPTSYDVWTKVAERTFSNPNQRKLWVDSEILLYQKQRRIWADIEPISSPET